MTRRASSPRPARRLRRKQFSTPTVPPDGRRRRLRPHRAPMRTVVEALGALSSRLRGPTRGSVALPARRQPRADREVGLSQELSPSARLRLRARRRRSADRRGGRSLRGGRDWTDGARRERTRAGAGRLLSRLSDGRRARPVPRGGLIFDVACDCFRREPSRDIDRLQSFRMREYVVDRRARADDGVPRAAGSRARAGIADALGLSHRIEAASDPFFGRGGAMVGRFQVEQR